MNFERKILCIGAGYVGGTTMAMIAYKCPQYRVSVVDINSERIAQWNSDDLPIYEPDLSKIVSACRNRNLFFDTDIEKGIKESEIIFVSVNSPTKTFGEGAGMAADLQYWEKSARNILKYSESDKIIVEKSTLPVKTAQAMEHILFSSNNGIHFEVLSNPEFLAEGTAIRNLENPDRILIGSHNTPTGIKARDVLIGIYSNWVSRDRIISSNVWSSELSKLVANAFLAQRISSINSISALCEKTEADIKEISYAVGMDSRIGSKYLEASLGFGGSCLKKDILNLVYLCRHYGLDEAANYWEGILKINDYQKDRFVKNMLNAMFNTLTNKKICLFGFAFKANTGDVRESPAIYIAKKLLDEKARLVITDPKALNNAKMELTDINGDIEYIENPYEAASGCDAIAVMTEWNIYKELDYESIYKVMTKPAYIFDGRNLLDHNRLFNMGFNVYPLGKPSLTTFEKRGI